MDNMLNIVSVILFTIIVYKLSQVGRRDSTLPPGPPTLPILGNLHQIPKSGAHFKFTEWAQKYGGLISIKLGPGNLIVVTDRQIARALFDDRGSIYSDRPDSYVFNELITGGDHLLTMKYGPKWRKVRSFIHQRFLKVRCDEEILPVLNAESIQMTRDFLIYSSDFMSHPKRYSNSTLMSQVFGVRTPTHKTQHMRDLYDMIEKWAEVGEIGSTPPVDILPIFKWLPERIWANWKSRARVVGIAMKKLYHELVEQAQTRRSKGIDLSSIVDSALSGQKFDRGEIDFACGIMIEAGSDTTSAMITACLHAMTKYPDIQRKAHEEIDAAIPRDRSPQWSDYDKLPYISQIVKETLRWRPTAPLAIPHATSADDVYNGMVIPKGSTVILNVWGLHNDPNSQPPPDVFEPDRFIGRTKPAAEYISCSDPAMRDHYAYGAGRRVCPGIHLAERALFVGIAKLLWAFSFNQASDQDGKLLPIDVDFETGYTHGFAHCPKPFPCQVQLRHAEKRGVIFDEFEQVKSDVFSKFEH